MSNVFIALQANEDTRSIVQAIEIDNPEATVERQPAMVRIFAPGHLVVRKQTIESEIGRVFDLQELQINLITLSGHVEEDDETFTLHWND